MDNHERTPQNEVHQRIKNFQIELQKSEIDGALIVQFVDLFYFTGTSQSGHLYVPAEGKPTLMIRKSFARAKEESSIENIIELKSNRQIPEVLASTNVPEKLGMELDVIPHNTYKYYEKLFPESEIIDISKIIKSIRSIKSSYEIGMLQNAASILDSTFNEVPSMYQASMTELELASKFEQSLRSKGYGGGCRMRAFNQDYFYGNVNTGSSGSIPTYFDGPVGGPGLSPANNPHGAGWKTVSKDEVVYIDYTCVIDGYTADAARMFATGKLDDHLIDAHKIAMEIQHETTTMMKPGINCLDVYNKSVEIATKYGLENNFMGMGPDRVVFLGHGVGLELDEFPIFARGLNLELKEGMTFAMEPKFIFPEGAIGTENTFAMTSNGPKFLTVSTEEIRYI